MISFPFWLLRPVEPQTAGDNRLPLAFSSMEKMASHLSGHTTGEWTVRLVNRYSAEQVLLDLSQRGLTTLCYDANDDGSGGTAVPLGEILNALDLEK